MIRIELEQVDTAPRVFVLASPVRIGRCTSADIRVNHWRVARQHAVLSERQGTLWVRDEGTWNGTWVNGLRVLAETPLEPNDSVRIGPAVMRVRWQVASSQPSAPPDSAHACGDTLVPSIATSAGLPYLPDIEMRAPLPPPRLQPPPGVRRDDRGDCDDCDDCDDKAECGGADEGAGEGAEPDAMLLGLRDRLKAQLLDALDLRREDVAAMSDVHLRARAHDILVALIERDAQPVPPGLQEGLLRDVLDDAIGLGPLEALLAEDEITEIMVNRFDEIYVERCGQLTRVTQRFSDNASVLAVIERIVAPLGRRIDERSPMVDARLPDGSRVNGVIPPVALKGPTLTIRKFARRRLELVDLVEQHCVHPFMAAFLTLCVQRKKNIVVSGGTGAGKTTLLNILSGLIGLRERIVTIEDAAELQLPHAHVVALEARPPNVEGEGTITIRDLVRNALRMRPDRIVVGECRGGEAFDMLAAMNTGHAGSLTTLHANTPRDALARLETMILMAGMDLPLAAIREHIAGGIDIVVQQVRREDGARMISEIAEVAGMESGRIQLQPVFHRTRQSAGWCASGVVPEFVTQWREQGVAVSPAWFQLGLEREPAECNGLRH